MKDVLINIKGCQSTDGEQEVIEMITEGKLGKKNGNFYITYPECDENGMDGVTTLLKVEQNQRVTLQRSGAMQSRMFIEKNKRHISHYNTSQGNMMIGVFGESISSTLKENGGELFMRYTVDINSAYSSTNELTVSIREATATECQ